MKHVKVEIKDDVQWVTLHRPDKRNAFDPEMIAELTRIFKAASSGKQRALVLAGEGASFCAGGDLEWMKSMAAFSFDENLSDSDKLFEMYQSARECPLPIVGRAHGHAFGGGLGLLAVCDIVAAEEKTQFCFSEVKWGLVPAVISSFVLEKMQPHKVREWMLTAKIFTAAEALSAGLVHCIGPLSLVDQFISETLRDLKKAGPQALASTKQLLSYLSGHPPSLYRERCTRAIAEARVSGEGEAGLQSFLQKKPPPWA